MMRLRQLLGVLISFALAPAVFGADSPAKAGKPCGDLCVFIKAVLKEKPAYAKFKGERTIGDEKETVFNGIFKPSEDAHCSLVAKSEGGAAEYSCFFGHGAGDKGAFPFPKELGRKKYSEVVQALKSAFPAGWEFKEAAQKSVFGAQYTTIATRASTHARVAAVLAFMGDENDEDTSAEVSLQFH